MCLILFAYKRHPDYRLILTANRDEFYQRPTAALHVWQDYPQVLAGRDMVQQGTWMGITRTGRFAAITNYREVAIQPSDAPSRGNLVAGFLTGSTSPEAYLEKIQSEAHRYSGFNLIVGDTQTLYYFGNRDGSIRMLEPGLFGLSNRLLDTDWPKVRDGKARLADTLKKRNGNPRVDSRSLLALLQDQNRPSDDRLPDTGVGIENERMLAPAFITSPDYGTRSSSILLMARNGRVDFREISWAPGRSTPQCIEDRQVRFGIASS